MHITDGGEFSVSATPTEHKAKPASKQKIADLLQYGGMAILQN
jgi:hypothetical protein